MLVLKAYAEATKTSSATCSILNLSGERKLLENVDGAGVRSLTQPPASLTSAEQGLPLNGLFI